MALLTVAVVPIYGSVVAKNRRVSSNFDESVTMTTVTVSIGLV